VSLRVVGAGLGRTGTLSLKGALEHLLGGPCYHMSEVSAHQEHIPVWGAAARGLSPDWNEFLRDFVATVDWPAVAFWEELSAVNPDAIVLLSYRDSQAWWESASQTIFPGNMQVPEGPWRSMIVDLFGLRFGAALDDRDACIREFERHNGHVRATVPADRLVEWQPGDGWEPLCAALGVPVPDEPFPHVNGREDWTKREAAST
jgi:hypothetical protein